MQPVQTERLRRLIETSPILSPAERADWLDVLILMNDKQATELEEILTSQRSGPSPTQPLNNRLPQNIPPLSHISNLPADLTVPKAAAAGGLAPRPPRPWAEQFQSTMPEKELQPPARPKVAPPPPVDQPSKPAASLPVNARATVLAAAPPPPSGPAAAPIRRRSVPPKAQLETLTDAAKLSVGAIRGMDAADLLVRLQQLSRLEGYFNLLSYLEDSPLYRSYINTGRKILSGELSFDTIDRNDTSLLTKEEFEAFTDILRKIQLN